MPRVTATVDQDDLRALERKLTTIVRPAAERIIERGAPYIRDQARAGAPRATGALASSLTVAGRGLEARVHSPLPRALPVEFGRRAGAPMPPAAAFRGGYPAALAVARRGIPGRFFLRRATDMFRNSELPRLFRRAIDEIESAWRR